MPGMILDGLGFPKIRPSSKRHRSHGPPRGRRPRFPMPGRGVVLSLGGPGTGRAGRRRGCAGVQTSSSYMEIGASRTTPLTSGQPQEDVVAGAERCLGGRTGGGPGVDLGRGARSGCASGRSTAVFRGLEGWGWSPVGQGSGKAVWWLLGRFWGRLTGVPWETVPSLLGLL